MSSGEIKLHQINDDPRLKEIKNCESIGVYVKKKNRSKGVGRNTQSFDPKSTLVRPEMRILIGPSNVDSFKKTGKTLKHDDVVIVPDFFCKEDDWGIYYRLVEEMREEQAKGTKNSEWIRFLFHKSNIFFVCKCAH
jgi:hypothetical protein